MIKTTVTIERRKDRKTQTKNGRQPLWTLRRAEKLRTFQLSSKTLWTLKLLQEKSIARESVQAALRSTVHRKRKSSRHKDKKFENMNNKKQAQWSFAQSSR